MKLTEKLAEHYYTASEARKKLGLDESTFQYWGRQERVTRRYLPGRKQPLYLKSEIDDLVNRIETTVIAQKSEGIEYKKATINDLEQEYQLGLLTFGRTANSVEVRKAFMEKNLDIDYHLYDHSSLMAYINVMPVKNPALEEFMSGKIRGWQIKPSDVEPFVPGVPVECLIMDLVSTPNVPPIQRSFYSSRLLTHLLGTLKEMGEQGIEITKIHAIGGTPYGQRILRSAGFTEGKEVAPGRIPFVLDIASSNDKILRQYKDCLAQWKKQHKASANGTSKTKSKKPVEAK